MREIKFRGKAVETNEWVYGSLVQCEVSGKEYIFPKGNEVNESEKVDHYPNVTDEMRTYDKWRKEWS